MDEYFPHFCDQCQYQLENRIAKCRHCGQLHSGNEYGYGDPSKPFFGIFKDQWENLDEEHQRIHRKAFFQHKGAFEKEYYRFIYYPPYQPKPAPNKQPQLTEKYQSLLDSLINERETTAEEPCQGQSSRQIAAQSSSDSEESTSATPPGVISRPVPDRSNFTKPAPRRCGATSLVDIQTQKAQPPSDDEELVDLYTNILGTVRDKVWYGARCHCGGAHDPSVCEDYEKYLEILILAYANDFEGDCILCMDKGAAARSHNVWQHRMGVWRDHPQNPTLPADVNPECERPYPKGVKAVPLPAYYFRPNLFSVEAWYSKIRILPEAFQNGLKVGLWHNRAKNLRKAFEEGFDKAVSLSEKSKNDQLRIILDLRPRLLPRILRLGAVVVPTFGRRSQSDQDAAFGGIPHHPELPDSDYRLGQHEWSGFFLALALSPIMHDQDTEEVARLEAIHTELSRETLNPNTIQKMSTAAFLAWRIYAVYIPLWDPERTHKINEDGETGDVLAEVRSLYKAWPV